MDSHRALYLTRRNSLKQKVDGNFGSDWLKKLGGHGLRVDDDPAAVGVGDVVEAKKLSRTPTNQRASDLVEHGLDLNLARRESRGIAEESIAGFLGLEASGSPRNECGLHYRRWLAFGHGGRPFG
jgi:hypothetical protein